MNRTISMAKKYFDGIVTNPRVEEKIDEELKNLVLETPKKVEEKMNDLRIADAMDLIFEIFRRSNKYIDETMPWILAKEEEKQDRLKTVLYNLLEAIRSGAILLSAFLPDTAERIFQQLNIENKGMESINFEGIPEGLQLKNPEPIFLRIDKEEKLKELGIH